MVQLYFTRILQEVENMIVSKDTYVYGLLEQQLGKSVSFKLKFSVATGYLNEN